MSKTAEEREPSAIAREEGRRLADKTQGVHIAKVPLTDLLTTTETIMAFAEGYACEAECRGRAEGYEAGAQDAALLREVAGFFMSVARSGEPWTKCCSEMEQKLLSTLPLQEPDDAP